MPKEKKQRSFKTIIKTGLIILLTPLVVLLFGTAFVLWKEPPMFVEKTVQAISQHIEDRNGGPPLPIEYIRLYQAAAEEYDIPWTLLAAVHRIETRFSTMDTLISPVGAEGHMQFMPCTFVGWNHPSCSGLGEGDIPKEEKTNPVAIAKYGGYGVDANGDGIADPFNIEDAVYSAANYLAATGAKNGDIKEALFNYNRSEQYVDDVYAFYEEYEARRYELEVAARQ